MLCLLSIRINIRARHDPHPVHSVFNTHLFVFVTEAIRICIYIRDYPCSNSNPIRNVKADTISTIFVRIRSVYIPTLKKSSSSTWCSSTKASFETHKFHRDQFIFIGKMQKLRKRIPQSKRGLKATMKQTL